MPAQQQGQRTPKLLATKFEIFKSIDFDVESNSSFTLR